MLPNGVHHIDITFGPGQSQNVEVVVNEGSGQSGTWWGYTGTITGQGQRPIVINGGQPITPMQPPSVVTGTGRIFNPTSGGGGRSVAGTGNSSRRNRAHHPKTRLLAEVMWDGSWAPLPMFA